MKFHHMQSTPNVKHKFCTRINTEKTGKKIRVIPCSSVCHFFFVSFPLGTQSVFLCSEFIYGRFHP